MQLSRELAGVKTEVLIQSFADRLFVLVTQVGKVGSLTQATIPATTPLRPSTSNALPEPSAAIQLTPLLGSAPSEHLTTLHSLYASQIATIMWTRDMDESGLVGGGDRRGIIVGLALKNTSRSEEVERSTFIGVMQMINDLIHT